MWTYIFSLTGAGEILTQFHFYTGFLTFSWGIEKVHWGNKWVKINIESRIKT